MNRQTRVNSIKVKNKAMRLSEQPPQLVELPERRSGWKSSLLRLDVLFRNAAVVGCLALVVAAVRSSTLPEAQSVFGMIKSASGMQWDESLGKLSFVNSLLPAEIQVVWNEGVELELACPPEGEVTHAWSSEEPYVLIEAQEERVFASSEGEVMSVAHGLNEEYIVRLMHDGAYETIYGNIEECYVEPGDYLHAGEMIGKRILSEPLAFEVRYHGKSVEPVFSRSAQ